jgi:flagellar hook-associated protein 3 FlgL
MRITTVSAFESSVQQLQRRQNKLSTSQEQLTSGKRVLRASDDPAAAARAERALSSINRAEASQRALDASRSAMQFTESALGDANELIQRARELVVSAGNGSYSDSERRNVAEAIRGIRDDLLSVANRTDGAGRYLFGGQGSGGPPLQDTPDGVVYVGINGVQEAAAGEGAPLSVDGHAAWLGTTDPADPNAKISIFDALDRVVGDLLTPGRSSTEVASTVARGLGEIDATTATLAGWRARAGETLNRLDGLESRLAQAKVDAQRDRSDAEDLDLVAAISDFQSQQTGYDAALKTYSMVQRMSLFDYLK